MMDIRPPGGAFRVLVTIAAGGLAGCFNTPDFSPASLVDRPRILAVVADPPEITPGADARLSVLVAGAEPERVIWRVCATFSSFGAGTQYGENTGDRGCTSSAVPEVEGNPVQVPATSVGVLLDNDQLLKLALGAQLSDAAVDQVKRAVGVAVSVEADVTAGGKRLRALKRVILSQSAEPAHNPPPPALRVGSRELRVQASDSFRCVPDDPEPLRVAPGERVRLTPLYEGSDKGAAEPWLETYRVLDARGVMGTRKEQAFYSWFASHGSIEHGKTEAPDRESFWDAPDEPGCAELWLVVRDGHAGESACGLSVRVGDVDDCAP
jgi:hypothetical protein